MKYSVVIPTYKRRRELAKCLNSIFDQDALPTEVVLIDDGNLLESFVNKRKEKFQKKNIDLLYYKKDHPAERRGLSESKNIGTKLVKNEIFFILDDDLILEKDFFKRIINIWKKNKDYKNLVGVGGIITNNRKKNKLEKFYNKVFRLTSINEWDVNSVGFQVWNDQINKQVKGYYVHGGVCSYRKSIIEELGGFVTFSGGRTANEDVDFCLRAKNKGYHFIINPEAKVFHKQSKVSRENDSTVGFKDAYNRKIIFKNHCKKSTKNYLWFYWANVGWILRQLLTGQFKKGFGMIKGLITKT